MNESTPPTPEEWATKLEQILTLLTYAIQTAFVLIILVTFVVLVRSIPKHNPHRKQARR